MNVPVGFCFSREIRKKFRHFEVTVILYTNTKKKGDHLFLFLSFSLSSSLEDFYIYYTGTYKKNLQLLGGKN